MKPVTLSEQVEAISLVYGSEDYIAFGENISLADLVAPAEYSQTVRSCINSAAPARNIDFKRVGTLAQSNEQWGGRANCPSCSPSRRRKTDS